MFGKVMAKLFTSLGQWGNQENSPWFVALNMSGDKNRSSS